GPPAAEGGQPLRGAACCGPPRGRVRGGEAARRGGAAGRRGSGEMSPLPGIRGPGAVGLAALAARSRAVYLPGFAPVEYDQGVPVELKVNKLTSVKTQLPYRYYTLPYCEPAGGIKESQENLGETLTGDQIENSPYEIKVLINQSCTTSPAESPPRVIPASGPDSPAGGDALPPPTDCGLRRAAQPHLSAGEAHSALAPSSGPARLCTQKLTAEQKDAVAAAPRGAGGGRCLLLGGGPRYMLAS
ncbi:unnamed protein product, partial [Prorocentrum cordatum]